VDRAVLWRGGTGAPVLLNTLLPNPVLPPGGFLGNSRALAINNSGVIVGWSDTVRSPHAFLFDPTTNVMRDLGSLVPPNILLGTPDPSQALDVDDGGNVVGNTTAVDARGNVVTRAFLLKAGALFISDLGTLIPDLTNAGAFLGDSSAIAINKNGVIVGDSDAPAGAPARGGAVFTVGSVPTLLAPIQMTVLDINDNDVVVGSLGNPPNQAFSFSRIAGIQDLSNLLAGHRIVRAAAINKRGQIAAIANNGSTNSAVLIS